MVALLICNQEVSDSKLCCKTDFPNLIHSKRSSFRLPSKSLLSVDLLLKQQAVPRQKHLEINYKELTT
jgi:hypothetical protein